MNKVYVLEKLNMMEGMPNFFYAILKSLVLLAFIAFYCVLFDNVSITTKMLCILSCEYVCKRVHCLCRCA